MDECMPHTLMDECMPFNAIKTNLAVKSQKKRFLSVKEKKIWDKNMQSRLGESTWVTEYGWAKVERSNVSFQRSQE